MRKILIGLLLLGFSITGTAQGKLLKHEFTAPSLQNNIAGEYIGDHGNMLDGFDGRIFNELLPFFNTYLK